MDPPPAYRRIQRPGKSGITSIKYGVATFIVLDLNNTSDDNFDNHDPLGDGHTPDWEPGSEQYNWMVNELQKAQNDGAFTFVMCHPSPYSRGVHGTDDPAVDSQRGYELRALDPIFRQYGVDGVITGHDHMVEHCLTGPEGFEAAMDVTDPNNLNYLVQGNSGNSARAAEDYSTGDWRTWMDILGDDAAPYYTTYFYDWEHTDYRSFLDINFVNLGNGIWRADFRTMRVDDAGADAGTFDEFSLTRMDIPEPATLSLLAVGAVALIRRKKR